MPWGVGVRDPGCLGSPGHECFASHCRLVSLSDPPLRGRLTYHSGVSRDAGFVDLSCGTEVCLMRGDAPGNLGRSLNGPWK